MATTGAIDATNQARRLSAYKQPRDSQGRFIKEPNSKATSTQTTAPFPTPFPSSSTTGFASASLSASSKKTFPALLEIKVTNPITYIKAWWKQVMTNEGVDFRFRIHPLTAIAIVGVIATLAFGVGRFALPAGSPIIKYIPQLAPPPIPDPWKETAFTGSLKYTKANKRYYLVTNDSEAITLEVPSNVDMTKLIDKRILAVGKYNTQTGILAVTEASDLEILPNQITPVPTIPMPQAPPQTPPQTQPQTPLPATTP